jgi:hypothetical protein
VCFKPFLVILSGSFNQFEHQQIATAKKPSTAYRSQTQYYSTTSPSLSGILLLIEIISHSIASLAPKAIELGCHNAISTVTDCFESLDKQRSIGVVLAAADLHLDFMHDESGKGSRTKNSPQTKNLK